MARLSEKYVDKRLRGRIISMDRIRGFGFIRTERGEDVFFSTYNTDRKLWHKMSIGDYVEFVAKRRGNDRNNIIANDVTVIKRMPKGYAIELPNGEMLEVKHINKFGVNSMLMDELRDTFTELPPRCFKCIFIKTNWRTFTFNDPSSPIIIDGEVDVEEFYEELCEKLWRYDLDKL